MSVTHEEVLKIAQLAELDVDETTLPVLTEQMSRILEFVAQIGAVPQARAPSRSCRAPMRCGSAPTRSSRGRWRLDPTSWRRHSGVDFFWCRSWVNSRKRDERSRRGARERQGGGRPDRQGQAPQRLSHAAEGAAAIPPEAGPGRASVRCAVRDAG